MHTSKTYSLAAVRALTLHTQGLGTPLGAEPRPDADAIYRLIARLGALQIDSIHGRAGSGGSRPGSPCSTSLPVVI